MSEGAFAKVCPQCGTVMAWTITTATPPPEAADGQRVADWRAEICPSCDDHDGYWRQWSLWTGTIRMAHGLYRSEAELLAADLNELERNRVTARAAEARVLALEASLSDMVETHGLHALDDDGQRIEPPIICVCALCEQARALLAKATP